MPRAKYYDRETTNPYSSLQRHKVDDFTRRLYDKLWRTLAPTVHKMLKEEKEKYADDI